MQRELKLELREGDVACVVRAMMEEEDAQLERTECQVYTYFVQPIGFVCKVADTPRGSFLSRMKRDGSSFLEIERTKLEDGSDLPARLRQRFGIRCVLENQRSVYSLHGMEFGINIVRDVGIFLTAKRESLTFDDLGNFLYDCGISVSIVTDSFDELYLGRAT